MSARDTRPDELLPIGVAALLLGVQVDTVRAWEADGRLSSVRTPGNHRRYLRRDVEALLAERAESA